jgi:hypothetical protein
VAHLRQQFDAIDRDRSGSITTNELSDFQADIVRRRSSSAGASDAPPAPLLLPGFDDCEDDGTGVGSGAGGSQTGGQKKRSTAGGAAVHNSPPDMLSPVPELKDAEILMGALDLDGTDEIDFHEYLAAAMSKEIYKVLSLPLCLSLSLPPSLCLPCTN